MDSAAGRRGLICNWPRSEEKTPFFLMEWLNCPSQPEQHNRIKYGCLTTYPETPQIGIMSNVVLWRWAFTRRQDTQTRWRVILKTYTYIFNVRYYILLAVFARYMLLCWCVIHSFFRRPSPGDEWRDKHEDFGCSFRLSEELCKDVHFLLVISSFRLCLSVSGWPT